MEVNSQNHALIVLPLGKGFPIRIEYVTGWAPEPVWTLWGSEKEKGSRVLKECKKWME
jgi:hypothetical protein